MATKRKTVPDDDADREHGPPAGPPRPMREAARPVLRFIGEHVRGFHAAVGLFLVLGLGVIAVTVVVFALLADAVAEGQTQRVDTAILRWIDSHATPALDVLAMEVTSLGSGMVVWTLVLVASAFLWTTRHRYSVLLLWVAMGGSALLSTLLKAFFDRPRPQVFPWRVPYAGQASFPSGHSMTAMVGYATLAYLLTRLEPSRRMRRLTFAVAGTIVILVGLSRLYLGVHWPSDVAAGFVVGLAWASFCALGIEAVRYFRTRRPEVASEEKDLNAGAASTETAPAEPAQAVPRPAEKSRR